MADTSADMKRAIEAYRAGRRTEARDLLLEIVDRDEENERAWLYLSALVDTREEQQICLENVLALNPHNEKAQRGLDALRRTVSSAAEPSAPPVPPTDRPPASQHMARVDEPRVDEPNPFGEQSFEEWLASAQSAYAAPHPTDSPDVARRPAPAPTDAGSDQEGAAFEVPPFEEWMASFGGEHPAENALSPVTPPWVAAVPEPTADPPPALPAAEDSPGMPATTGSGPGEDSAQFAAEAPFPFEDDVSAAPERSGRDGEAHEVAPEDEWLAAVATDHMTPALAPSPGASTPAQVAAADYYRYIPSEIEGTPAHAMRRLLATLLIVVLLAALNALSFAELLGRL